MKKAILIIIVLLSASSYVYFSTRVVEENYYYTILYKDEYGTLLRAEEVVEGELLSLAEGPEREDHIFEGWYLDKDFRREFTGEVSVYSDYVLYGKWSEIEEVVYHVTFYDDDGTIIQQEEVQNGTLLPREMIPEDPSKDGAVFMGWDSKLPNILLSTDINIYATYDYGENYYNSGISISDNYTVYSDEDRQVIINKIDDPSYERIIEMFPEDFETDNVFHFNVKDNNLVIFVINPDTRLLDIHFFKLDDQEYYETIETSLVKQINPVTERYEIEFVDDYIMLHGFNCGYCCLGDPNTVYVYRFGDVEYERVIQRDVPYVYECKALRASFEIIDEYIFFYDDFSVKGSENITIYNVKDDDYKQVIENEDLHNETPFLAPIAVRGNYVVTIGYSRAMTQNFMRIYDLNDTNSYRTIFGYNVLPSDRFASSFLIEDDYIIIGSKFDDNNTGAVYVYSFNNPAYRRVIIGSDAQEGDYFGASISLQNGMLVTRNLNVDNGTGKVYVYSLEDDSYERIISQDDPESDILFGTTVKVSDDYILVGEYGCIDFANNCFGSKHKIHVFKLSDPGYMEIINLDLIRGVMEFPKDGFKFETVGDYLIATSVEFDRETGFIAIYDLSTSAFIPIVTQVGDDVFDHFGKGVYFDGETLIVGDEDSTTIFNVE